MCPIHRNAFAGGSPWRERSQRLAVGPGVVAEEPGVVVELRIASRHALISCPTRPARWAAPASAARKFRRIPWSPARSSGVSPKRRANSSSSIRSNRSGPRAGERVAGAKLLRRARLGEALVPGADLVADVAAEDPPFQPLRERLGDGSLLLDREIGDAAGGVEQRGARPARRWGRRRGTGCSCRSGRWRSDRRGPARGR